MSHSGAPIPHPAGGAALQLHRRTPGGAVNEGSQGHRVSVKSNMFQAQVPGVQFTHYDGTLSMKLWIFSTLPGVLTLPKPIVTFDLPLRRNASKKNMASNPEEQEDPYPPVKAAHKFIDHLQLRHAPDLFNPRGAYDGRRNLFMYDSRVGSERTFEFSMNSGSDRKYKVSLKRVGMIDTSVLKDLVRGSQGPQSDIAVTAVNTLVRVVPSQKDVLATRRSFFQIHKDTKPLGGGLELLRGWYQSVRPAIGKMVINIDTANAVMIKAGSLLNVCVDFLVDEHSKNHVNVRSILDPMHLSDIKLKQLNRLLKGKRLVRNGNHPGYRQLTAGGMRKESVIEKIEQTSADRYLFRNERGDELSVKQYFQGLGKALDYPTIACVRLKSQHGDVIVPLELYDVLPGQLYKSKLSSDATANMIKFTKLSPIDRERFIHEGHKFMGYDQDYVARTGMTVDSQLQEIRGRVLDPPMIYLGEDNITPSGGSWNMLNKKLFRPGRIKAWGFVDFENQNPRKDAGRSQAVRRSLVVPLMDVLRRLGMRVDTDPYYSDQISIQGNISSELDSFHTQVVNHAMTQYQRQGRGEDVNIAPEETLVVALLRMPHNEIRDQFKRWGDILRGVPTQIIVSSKVFKFRNDNAVNQYCNNLSLKINAKMGGLNCNVNNRWFQERPTMIIGADVSHAAPGSKSPSVCSMVFSHNFGSCSDYFAVSDIQATRQEVIEGFGGQFEYALQRFHQSAMSTISNPDPKMKYLPWRVIIYRDGVSEGEYEAVINHELKAVKTVLAKLRSDAKVTFIIVTKRHHVRFFPSRSDYGDKTGNCKAGLVVDNGIVHPVYEDFFIQSQKGLAGTSRSSRYVVLHDDNNMTKDELQRLSFDLCHVYARSTLSVSIPAPVYYADIVCSRSTYHYDPNFLDSQSVVSDDVAINLQEWRQHFNPVAKPLQKRMYFM
ncbi:Piwi domain-containing protein [Cantharellus anzutake]|uniref:Piwi domain-containing protein n=1 Tax=Cantharellus anzutake TaxID=1750568 RepID=UPI0019085480|nr:Piwi domain-containing protein [Cantharellus anzutake]KAF8338286.1 Piwi domain-containing protein [Cantharellus anzutake]